MQLQAPSAAVVDLIYFNAGGGHRAAAEALHGAIAAQCLPWRVRMLNLFELLDPQQHFRRITGLAPEALYNQRLARGWTLGMAQELRVLQAAIRLAHPLLVQRLQQHWRDAPPSMVVSLVPNFNRALGHGLRAAVPDAPFVTVLTDLADHPPHFWLERDATRHVVCGTERAVQQAHAVGLDPRRIHRVSGMLLRPDFYRPPAAPRADARRALGLDAHTPTGLVMFGGQGSNAMLDIADSLPRTPLLLMCGHNQALAERLRARPAAAPRVVIGYTPLVADVLRLADFFIGKPGPGSLSEALHCGLPVIVTRNAFTMPQERWNTEWVRDMGVGIVMKSFADLPPAVQAMSASLPSWAERVRRLDNRALFELPRLLLRILHGDAHGHAQPPPQRAQHAANDEGAVLQQLP